MSYFEVLLGVDRAAVDTGRRMMMKVLGTDAISAAIHAEQLADRDLDDPEVEYTHAIQVTPVNSSVAMAMAA